jgi:hypothetical protein
VAVADLNGDGKLDMATADTLGSTVSVFLGNGDGTFQNARAVFPGPFPSSVAVGDFNGDGKLDLAVGVFNLARSGIVAILLGNGDGSFRSPVLYATPAEPQSVAVADLRGNGKLDVVAANGDGIDILLGNGDGTFQPGGVSVGPGTDFVTVGDFNGDGKPDLAVSSNSGFNILLGNGDGTFHLSQTIPAGIERDIALGDFNHDGKLDLAAFEEGRLAIFLGNGDGTFRASGVTPTGSNSGAIAVGDFNGDGNLDIAAEGIGDSTLDVRLGNGDGTFQASISFEIPHFPQWVAAGDFTGNGKLDLAVSEMDVAPAVNDVAVFLNQNLPAAAIITGDDFGTLARVDGFDANGNLLYRFHPFPTSFEGGMRVAVADFNADGVPDIVVATGSDPAVKDQVRITDGKTGWQMTGPLGSLNPYGPNWFGAVFVAAGNLDGDADNDLVTGADFGGGPHVKVFDGTTGAVMQYPNHPELTDGFYAYAPIFAGGVRVAVGDVNGDGRPDIITGAGPGGGPHVRVFDAFTLDEIILNTGPGFMHGFYAFAPSDAGGVYVAAGDTNSDGKADVIVGMGQGSKYRVFSGADGSILQEVSTPFTTGVRVAAGAFDGDANADIVTGNGPNFTTEVIVFDGTNQMVLDAFFAEGLASRTGLFVGVPVH